MPMMWMVMPGRSPGGSALVFLVMWQAMMIAMMLPSSWPMLELYARVATGKEAARVIKECGKTDYQKQLAKELEIAAGSVLLASSAKDIREQAQKLFPQPIGSAPKGLEKGARRPDLEVDARGVGERLLLPKHLQAPEPLADPPLDDELGRRSS